MGTTKNARTGENGAGAISDFEHMAKDTYIPIIPQNSSLEEAPSNSATKFTDEIFDDLPPLLRDACDRLTDQSEKEVFLVGALGIVSGILPNVRGFYDGAWTYCNLFVYVIGSYGIGKGGLKLAYKLGKAIHKHRREQSGLLQAEYAAACIEAKETKEPEPLKPGHKLLFIPADNSKSGIVENLDSNDGAGIIFETEGDTLADNLKTDYGGYSDTLRKAFHGEQITINRRGGGEFREIENPRLSVVLSSTVDQYQKLVPTIQNGLFSRFLHYRLSPTHEFKNVFDNSKRGYPEFFDELGETLLKHYLELEENHKEAPIEIEFQKYQKEHFLKVFRGWKQELGENVSHDLDGTVNRLGLICFRVAMLLTAIRNFEQGDYSLKMEVHLVDFENAVRIVEVLKAHALAVFYDLPNPAVSKEAAVFEKELTAKKDAFISCQRLRALGKSYAEIAKEVLGDAAQKSTVFRWLNRI